MNRKLQHSVTALSATAAVFGLLLLAGGPPPLAMPTPGAQSLVAAELVEASSPDIDEGEAATRRLRHQRRARTGLALPYFSFAHGLRTVAGS